MFPVVAPQRTNRWPTDDAGRQRGLQRRPNLSAAAQRYLDRLGLGVEDLFHHALAVLHDPAYREANAGALADGVAPHPPARLARRATLPDALPTSCCASAARGRELGALLDPETPVAGRNRR